MPGKQAAPGAGMAGGMQNRMVYPNQTAARPVSGMGTQSTATAGFIQLPSNSRQHLHMHIQVSRSHASLRARLSR